MSEYTPGDWQYSVLNGTDIPRTLFSVYDDEEIDIAVFEEWSGNNAEMQANARLISAAPLLLETCETVLESLPDTSQCMLMREMLKKVIAKAKGD